MKVGIIGVGTAGRARARAVQSVSGLSLVGVHRGRFASDTSAPEVACPEALARQVDVLVVSAPDDTHETYVRLGLVHGCHVLCEFPVAQTYDGWLELQALAKHHRRALGVGHIEWLSPTQVALERWASERSIRHLTLNANRSCTADSVRDILLAHVARLHRAWSVAGPLEAHRVRVHDDRVTVEARGREGCHVLMHLACTEQQGRSSVVRVEYERGEFSELRKNLLYRDGVCLKVPSQGGLFRADLSRFVSRLVADEASFRPPRRVSAIYRFIETLMTQVSRE
ncbi:MAG: Gfo/Idh/MocA family protein [Myxococcota bacterium]